MYRHRVFYANLEDAENALQWIVNHIEDVEDEDTSQGDHETSDECFFKTHQKLSDSNRDWIVRSTGAIEQSFNNDDY